MTHVMDPEAETEDGEEEPPFIRYMKLVLLLLNFISLILGGSMMGFGSWVVNEDTYMQTLLQNKMYMGGVLCLVVAGVVIIMVSFLGCWGAVKDSKCMLSTYSLILILFFLTMLSGSIVLFVFRDKVADKLKTELLDSMSKYTKDGVIQKAWDDVQKHVNCCGVDNYQDWVDNGVLYAGEEVPSSCCITSRDCTRLPTLANTKQGCKVVIEKEVRDNALLAGVLAVVFSCLVVADIVTACIIFAKT